MKIAIIDIGTRASRLIIGDTDDLDEYGFRFQDFYNDGGLSEAGRGIYEDEVDGTQYKMEYFEKTFHFIEKFLRICEKKNVLPENIYAVGTEVFRRVNNRNDILSLIQKAFGFPFKVLDPQDEAECTFWGAVITCRHFFKINEPILVFEQGGGSVQLTAGLINPLGRIEKFAQTSIPNLGTLFLRENFMKEQEGYRYVKTVSKDVYDYAQLELENTLSKEFNLLPEQMPSKVFALGSVITNLFNLGGRKIHGKNVPLSRLSGDLIKGTILERYENYAVKSLIKDAKNGQFEEDKSSIERKLERMYGLSCYAAVLEYFNLDRLQICGAGLRYGVFFKVANNEWHNIKEFKGKLKKGSSYSHIENLLCSEEGMQLEFKAAARWNKHSEQPDKEITMGILKTIAAFMNSRGGDLLIGVDDNRKVVGLEHDYRTLTKRKDSDGFLQTITTAIKNSIDKKFFHYFDTEMLEYDEYEICHIRVRSSDVGPVFVKSDKGDLFFIRTNNSTESLDKKDTYEYISANTRWSQQTSTILSNQ